MSENPNVADGPHTRSWANRRTRGGDPPSHQTHPWAARQQRDVDREREQRERIRPAGPGDSQRDQRAPHSGKDSGPRDPSVPSQRAAAKAPPRERTGTPPVRDPAHREPPTVMPEQARATPEHARPPHEQERDRARDQDQHREDRDRHRHRRHERSRDPHDERGQRRRESERPADDPQPPHKREQPQIESAEPESLEQETRDLPQVEREQADRPPVDHDKLLREYGRHFGRRPEARRGREAAHEDPYATEVFGDEGYPTDVYPTDRYDSTQHVTTQLDPSRPVDPDQPISFRRAAKAGLTSAWEGMRTEKVELPPPNPADLDTHLLTATAPDHHDSQAVYPHDSQAVYPHHHDSQAVYEEAPEESAATPRRRAEHSNRTRSSGKRLADGLVAMPHVEPVDPRNAILENPEVAEHKRFCWKCSEPVGRATAETPGVIAGECAKCKAPFNFHPTLVRGEMVAGQYEVQGCLAHGGLGWIYLAVDRNVSDRWVVLKGLQNQLDFEAQVVALAERQFLSEMTHPGIVKIYNFVKHRSSSGVSGGYIVMEYVGGRSLRRVMDLRAPQRLPVAEAVAYMMEALPALDYLHSLGLAYNDLKPDNVMVTEDEVKLIDLGAVAAMGAYGSIYGTPGYQAPEISETGPSVASDIYTVGRTLAALIMELPQDEQGHWSPGIPGPQDEPLMARYPTLHRLLQRATKKDPKRRFPSAYAMHCQLAGVLRAILAADINREHPQVSVEFGSLRGDFGIETLVEQTDGLVDGMHRNPVLEAAKVVTVLPVPLINPQDPSAELLSNTLYADPRYALDALHRTHERLKEGTIQTPHSFPVEFALAAARAYLDLGLVMYANQQLEPLQVLEGTDWRVTWYEGVSALLTRRYEQAFELFDTVHTMVPGEIAPQLAMAATAELRLHDPTHPDDAKRWQRAATHHYRAVWRTNRAVVSATFGLARRLAAEGKADEAAAALDQVPHASRHYATARMTTCLLLVSDRETTLTEGDLRRAQARLSEVQNDPRGNQLQVAVLGAALAWLRSGGRPSERTAKILGCTFNERGLRRGLESRLRSVARIAPETMHRYRLVDLANYVRPHSRW